MLVLVCGMAATIPRASTDATSGKRLEFIGVFP
jgi:hypothetical protein